MDTSLSEKEIEKEIYKAWEVIETRKFMERGIIPRVKRGAELLDEHMPGWWRAINLEKLSLATPNPDGRGSWGEVEKGCVLCQLDNLIDEDVTVVPNNMVLDTECFGDYTDAFQKIQSFWNLEEYPDVAEEIDDPDGSRYLAEDYSADLQVFFGFDRPTPDNGLSLSPEVVYGMMNDAWKDEITGRREEDGSQNN